TRDAARPPLSRARRAPLLARPVGPPEHLPWRWTALRARSRPRWLARARCATARARSPPRGGRPWEAFGARSRTRTRYPSRRRRRRRLGWPRRGLLSARAASGTGRGHAFSPSPRARARLVGAHGSRGRAADKP